MPTTTRSDADIQRFITAQNRDYSRIIREIRRGKKETHWMWYVFPQLRALAKSEMAWRFGIIDKDEAVAYLGNVTLRTRLYECTAGILFQRRLMFGDTDTRKLHRCMTLFREVADDPELPDRVLGKFFGGELHQKTLDVLAGRPVVVQDAWHPGMRSYWSGQVAKAQAAVARRGRNEPRTRMEVQAFVNRSGLHGAAARLIVDAWMQDMHRARREGYEEGLAEGRDEGYDEAQAEWEEGA